MTAQFSESDKTDKFFQKEPYESNNEQAAKLKVLDLLNDEPQNTLLYTS